MPLSSVHLPPYLAMKTSTFEAVLEACYSIDWIGKEQSQAKNAQRLLLVVPPEARTDLSLIDAGFLDELVVQLRKTGFNGRPLSDSTIRRYLSALRVILKRANRMGILDTLPLFPEERIFKKVEPRSLILQKDWIDECLRRMQPTNAALTKFLWHSACRVSEGLSLTKDKVTDEGVRIADTKGKQSRTLPLTDGIRESIDESLLISKNITTNLVFPIAYQSYRRDYDKAKNAVCDALGLSDEIKNQWTRHTLRHTAITRLAMEGWPASWIQAWAGHKSLSVSDRYVHQSGITLRQIAAGPACIREMAASNRN